MIPTSAFSLWNLLLLAAPGLQAASPMELLPTMGGAPVVDTGSELPFNRNATPITEYDYKLLTQQGYRFGDKGQLYAPETGQPVSMNDYFYVIEGARSRRRLQALLRIQLIQSRNAYSKDLPQKDREEIRSVARENWHLLSHRTREDLSSLFSGKEIYEMKRLPAWAPLAAPAPPVEIGDLPDGVVVPTDKALQTLAGPVMPISVEAETEKAAPVRRPKKKKKAKPRPRLAAVATPPPGWNAATPGTVKPLPPPWRPDPALPVTPLPAPWKRFKRAKEILKPIDPVPAVKALPAPWGKAPKAKPAPKAVSAPKPAPAPPSPPLVPQDMLPEDGFTPAERAMRSTMKDLKAPDAQATGYRAEIAAPPPVEVATGMAPILPPVVELPPEPAPVPAFAAPPQPKEIPVEYPEVDEAAFKSFLESAPYPKHIKPLLAMIGKHVREPERRVAIGILTTAMPHIVLDSRKSGEEARASIGRIEHGASFARTQIALNDGPVLSIQKSLLSNNSVFLMPDDSNYYAARGKAMPALEAYSRDSASVRDLKGEWGVTRLYKDGSTRLKRPEHAVAGALLNALMRIDGDLRGWVDDYHTRLRADAVEFRFYRSIKADTDSEPELDPQLTARYREWFHRPEDYLDIELNSFFERSREEELSMLESAGVEGVGKSGPAIEFRLPPADSPARRAWMESDRRARGKE